mmetsp:Transcript_10909/g.19853  ORF Transcript_10909/g.19853 Transcript_10909/m.19853 type:complete len:334 (+) Transcript_10909:768-1769(+)
MNWIEAVIENLFNKCISFPRFCRLFAHHHHFTNHCLLIRLCLFIFFPCFISVVKINNVASSFFPFLSENLPFIATSPNFPIRHGKWRKIPIISEIPGTRGIYKRLWIQVDAQGISGTDGHIRTVFCRTISHIRHAAITKTSISVMMTNVLILSREPQWRRHHVRNGHCMRHALSDDDASILFIIINSVIITCRIIIVMLMLIIITTNRLIREVSHPVSLNIMYPISTSYSTAPSRYFSLPYEIAVQPIPIIPTHEFGQLPPFRHVPSRCRSRRLAERVIRQAQCHVGGQCEESGQAGQSPNVLRQHVQRKPEFQQHALPSNSNRREYGTLNRR